MTALLATVLAGLAAGLLAGGRPTVLRVRLAPNRRLRQLVPSDRLRRLRWWKVGRRRRASAVGADVVAACLALGGELRAGAPAARALSIAAEDWPDLFGAAVGTAAVGGDVAAALRVTAEQPGAAALRAVAIGWEVTERTGAPLASIVVAVADALRADEAVRHEAHSQLATAKTTARLLAALPFGTLLLLSGGDGDAVRFLLGSPYGLSCLGAALLLVATGLAWVDRLARSATRSPWEG